MTSPTRPAWLAPLATALRVAADALDGGSSAVTATAHPDKLALGLTALVRVVGPLQRIVEGRGNLEDDAQLANSVMDAVALAFPQTAGIIADIELAEPVFLWLAGMIKGGGLKIEPGFPPGWMPGPGNYRGHITAFKALPLNPNDLDGAA